MALAVDGTCPGNVGTEHREEGACVNSEVGPYALHFPRCGRCMLVPTKPLTMGRDA